MSYYIKNKPIILAMMRRVDKWIFQKRAPAAEKE
jgi:hypothetical protein